jgi:hypothetical protein
MTQLLERAFTEASKLPESEQDSFASLLLAELESERRWSQAFASTQDQFATLADEALREFEAGETLPMDIERDFPHH